MKKILIVEDDLIAAKFFEITIQSFGYETCGPATTAGEAVRIAREQDPCMIFMDLRLAGEEDGVDAAQKIYEFKQVPTVFVTGSTEQSSIDRINADHPAKIITKPVQHNQFREALEEFCPID